MKTMEEIRERFRVMSKTDFKNPSDMAGKTGVEQASLSRFLKEDSTSGLSLSTALKIIEYFGGEIVFPGDRKPETVALDDFVMVQKVKARLGAGSSLIVDGDVKGLYAFRQDFMERLHVINWRSLVLFDVMGDSMDPEIKNGDSVLVDTSDREIIGGLIYAIRVEDEIQVKRLNKVPGEIVVESVNKDVAPFRIPASKIEDGGFGVIGRVRWSGRVY